MNEKPPGPDALIRRYCVLCGVKFERLAFWSVDFDYCGRAHSKKQKLNKRFAYLNETPCHYCGGRSKTKDHIVPRALGGRFTKMNIVASCVRCNVKKGTSLPTCQCPQCRLAVKLWELTQKYIAANGGNGVLDRSGRSRPTPVQPYAEDQQP